MMVCFVDPSMFGELLVAEALAWRDAETSAQEMVASVRTRRPIVEPPRSRVMSPGECEPHV